MINFDDFWIKRSTKAWSIYTDLQSFLGTFPIQKVSISAVEDYSFEDELKLVEMSILAYSDSSPDKMCIFWTRFSAKIAFLPISETLQRKVSQIYFLMKKIKRLPLLVHIKFKHL